MYLLADKHLVRVDQKKPNSLSPFNICTNFHLNFNPQKEVNFFVDGKLISTKVTSIPGNKLDKSEKFVVTSKNEFNEDISIETSSLHFSINDAN